MTQIESKHASDNMSSVDSNDVDHDIEMPDISVIPIQESASSISTQNMEHLSIDEIIARHKSAAIKDTEESDYELPNTREALTKSKTYDSQNSVPSPPPLGDEEDRESVRYDQIAVNVPVTPGTL